MAFVVPLIAAAAAGAGTAAAGGSLITALGVASAALSGVSALQQGQYQAAVAKNNAKVAEQNAVSASEASQQEQVRSDREYAALLGEQLAAQGASGLDLLGRSQLQTRNVTRIVGREAAGDIRQRGTNAARSALQEAANFRAEGKQARTQGYIGAAGAALQAGSLVARRKQRPWDRSRNWYGNG